MYQLQLSKLPDHIAAYGHLVESSLDVIMSLLCEDIIQLAPLLSQVCRDSASLQKLVSLHERYRQAVPPLLLGLPG